jgi:hypothetical protein
MPDGQFPGRCIHAGPASLAGRCSTRTKLATLRSATTRSTRPSVSSVRRSCCHSSDGKSRLSGARCPGWSAFCHRRRARLEPKRLSGGAQHRESCGCLLRASPRYVIAPEKQRGLQPPNGGATPLATGVNRWNIGRARSASPQRGRQIIAQGASPGSRAAICGDEVPEGRQRQSEPVVLSPPVGGSKRVWGGCFPRAYEHFALRAQIADLTRVEHCASDILS